MDRTKKFLKKLPDTQQDEIDEILYKIERGEIRGLDIKKLKGHQNLYRVRVGSIRIVFSKEDGGPNVIFVGRRGDSKYSRF